MPKYGIDYSYLLCCNCFAKFDGDPIPEKCPFCGAKQEQFSYIVTKKDGRIITLKEERASYRRYLKAHLPTGMTADQVDRMSDGDVEHLCDIMAE